MYIRSIYTGQIYEVESMPEYEGYELSTREEYEEYMKKVGICLP